MSKVYPCPHCSAQNFATGARLRQAGRVPLTCWKCGEEIQNPLNRREGERMSKKNTGGKRRK
jgi:RNase P subunit RPR2